MLHATSLQNLKHRAAKQAGVGPPDPKAYDGLSRLAAEPAGPGGPWNMTLWHVPEMHAQSRQQYRCVILHATSVQTDWCRASGCQSRRLSRLLSRLVQGGQNLTLWHVPELCVDRAADSV